VSVVCQAFEHLCDFYEGDAEAMMKSLRTYVEHRDKGKPLSNCDGFTLISVPIVFPIELVGLFYVVGASVMMRDVAQIPATFGREAFKEFMRYIGVAELEKTMDHVTTEYVSKFTSSVLGSVETSPSSGHSSRKKDDPDDSGSGGSGGPLLQ